MTRARHPELHRAERIGWLRAAVLGANDGIVSTASLIVGVAAARADRHSVLLSGLAGLVAGAMSMAAGEYVSVSAQADTERADLAREKLELETDPEHEHRELAQIYEKRGLGHDLAKRVAEQLMSHDALKSHLRDELGITELHAARPVQAAMASAASFAVGAALPLLAAFFLPGSLLVGVPGLAVFPDRARRGLRPRGRSGARGGRAPGGLLGRARDGRHRGHRPALRRGGGVIS